MGLLLDISFTSGAAIAMSVELLPDRIGPGFILTCAGIGSVIGLARAAFMREDDAENVKFGTLFGAAFGLLIYLTLAIMELLS
jgi:hypothetical protein